MKALMFALALGAATADSATTDNPTDMMPVVSAGEVTAWRSMDGGAAGPMTVWIWTPPGYRANGGKRYPVLYMHDGQNIFDRALTGYDQEWGIDEAIPRMVARGDLREWIVVGVQSPKNRGNALFPEKLWTYLSPELRTRVTGGKGELPKEGALGDAYLRFLVNVVKPRVDRSYRTLPGAADTAVMGSSMGGLASFYAMAEYPHVFGQAACVSMHLPLSNSAEEGVDHARFAKGTAQAFAAYLRTSKMRPGRNHLYIDHGTGKLDGSYPPYADAIIPEFLKAGWSGPSFDYRVFTNADHNETAWSQRIDVPLGFLDRKDP